MLTSTARTLLTVGGKTGAAGSVTAVSLGAGGSETGGVGRGAAISNWNYNIDRGVTKGNDEVFAKCGLHYRLRT
jgi:hypothetical protein